MENGGSAAQEDRHSGDDDFVQQSCFHTLTGDVGSDDVDQSLRACGTLRCLHCLVKRMPDKQVRRRGFHGPVREQHLRSFPFAFEGALLLGVPSIGVIAVKSGAADQKCCDALADEFKDGVGSSPMNSSSQDMSPPRPAMYPSAEAVTE